MQVSPRWRWAVASRTGTSHVRMGTRKQDAYSVMQIKPNILCAVVSDGAGSASHGGQGASLLCRSLMNDFRAWFECHNDLPDSEILLCWIDKLRDRLSMAAEKRGVTRRQFAATLVMLVISKSRVLALQVGDSALVARKNGVWEALCWPENGEFASTTFFVTDDPEIRLHTLHLDLEYDAFALFSDGLESVALEHATHQPFARFFDPMIKPIDQNDGEGRLAELSVSLARYLDSPALCERTDDDKTLILISCK
ncbi:PP2C family serine/threonine-protein phosphatase [Pseudomonas sp. PA27(2017)]|uniref:PP2C family serine/threonine-protein phosphatase n=1 Tax=Pseudomonas sp. PA27(2017) TaxID=1932112 RepID=UPI00096754D4|nr:PP2C family serine/threonine-protein phosphatase [Pseudomonas sp. PA27(2017)]OLU32835.1 serine/threonine protein phosphatase [Pseudomonas sp. PA27(2017)]